MWGEEAHLEEDGPCQFLGAVEGNQTEHEAWAGTTTDRWHGVSQL